MSTRMKNVLSLLAIVLAFGIVGHMDAQDEACSWNSCHGYTLED